MRKVTYYIAVTIDGYIAGPDGQADFFPWDPDLMTAMNTEQPETVPSEFRGPAGLADAANNRFDTVLMGRGTYEPVLRQGTVSPYGHLTQYVFARSLPPSADPAVRVVAEDPLDVVRDLKRQDGMDIWLCGGGALAGHLLPEIDELMLKRYPIAIGAGIPLIAGRFGPVPFTRVHSRAFGTGAAVETYVRVSSAP
jgi:dihydrofolate reductase